jgi:hypothetical protein
MVIWAWPYLLLAFFTRDVKLWAEELLGSTRAIVMFSLSFAFLFLLFVDYDNIFRFHMGTARVLENALLITLVFVQALAPLLIVLCVYRILDRYRPQSAAIVYPALLAVLLHIIYFLDIVAMAFNYGI